MSYRRAVVVGSTAWGTTLAVLLARNGLDVTVLTRTEAEAAELEAAREHRRRLPGVAFPDTLHASGDPHALGDAELIVIGTPAQTVAGNLHAVATHVPASAVVLSASKGIEIATGRRMSEVIPPTVSTRHAFINRGEGPGSR